MQHILSQIITLTKNYAKTYRGNILEDKYNHFKALIGEDISFDQEHVRESLICHVGHLPIVASYLHQFCEHKDEIDLGRAMMMLAIHDIGETIVGDIITVNRDRSIDEKKEEDDAVKTLLNPEQRDLYQEYEANQNLTAKFAKAMDKLSAQIMVCSTDPAIEKARYEHFGFSLDDWSKYEKYMKRDSFLHEFFHHVWSSVREDWEQVK